MSGEQSEQAVSLPPPPKADVGRRSKGDWAGHAYLWRNRPRCTLVDDGCHNTVDVVSARQVHPDVQLLHAHQKAWFERLRYTGYRPVSGCTLTQYIATRQLPPTSASSHLYLIPTTPGITRMGLQQRKHTSQRSGQLLVVLVLEELRHVYRKSKSTCRAFNQIQGILAI